MERGPEIPEPLLTDDGWSLVEERTETLFRLPTARVTGHTVLYEDPAVRERVAAATGTDQVWRFVFATRVTFEPPLASGVGPAMLLPTVTTEARQAFEDDLRGRGFEDVRRGRRERTRTRSGDRLRLQEFTAALPVADTTVGVTGWLGVWTTDREFRVGGGAYPDLPALADALGVADLGPGPAACRTALFDLLRAVE